MKASSTIVFTAALAMGCSNEVVTPNGSGNGSGGAGSCGEGVERLSQSSIDQIDLLLVVDNGPSMGAKQEILATALPDLIQRLVNPPCLAPSGAVAAQPGAPTDACPAGSQRERPPVLDMHVGVLSSSLGTFGTSTCPDTTVTVCPGGATSSLNDRGHLVTRLDPCQAGGVPTYQDLGFLAWDPTQKLTPPGEGQGGNLTTSLHDLVVGDGADGCAFRSQNEAWYRFLVDPTPWKSIALVDNQVQVAGVDTLLLQQRKDFLRPGSLLAIIDVTDEDDASIKEYSSYPLFTEPDFDDDFELRTFGLITHEQHFGIEFFYQPSRYVTALTSSTVTDVDGKSVANPIFSNLDPSVYTTPVRDPSMVFYATITGVPWQLVARQKDGVPDLVNGVSALDPTQVGGFMTSEELSLKDKGGVDTFWDDIAGDPEHYVPARSPFMVESTSPRSGTDPITGIAVSPGGANPINGNEHTIPSPPGDIEYACTFPLLTPRDCSNPSVPACACNGGTTDNPLCAPNPTDNDKPTLQVADKAYPGVKNLAIAKGMGTQGIVASICAKQLTDPSQGDYGYRPAIKTIGDGLARRLRTNLSGECLSKPLTPDPQGLVACVVLEATKTSGACSCDPTAARSPVPPEDAPVVAAAMADPLYDEAQWNCFCEIEQASGSALADCRASPTPASDGWCYVDAAMGAEEASLVNACPSTEKHALRFIGAGAPAAGATVFIRCCGE